MNMTMVCQYATYRRHSIDSHRWDLVLPLVHPEVPRRGSLALKMNNCDVMILKFVRKRGEKDKEYGQLEDILHLIKIAQRGTEWVELNTSEHVIPKAFNSFFKSDF